MASSVNQAWHRLTLLFEGDCFSSSSDFEVAPDGRFLMIRQAPLAAAVGELQVVVNWRHELSARVSTSR